MCRRVGFVNVNLWFLLSWLGFRAAAVELWPVAGVPGGLRVGLPGGR
jgi:hypothetical protein